jgi:hypothetical protein
MRLLVDVIGSLPVTVRLRQRLSSNRLRGDSTVAHRDRKGVGASRFRPSLYAPLDSDGSYAALFDLPLV